jgi:predicted MFS family arabinose efflux permease
MKKLHAFFPGFIFFVVICLFYRFQSESNEKIFEIIAIVGLLFITFYGFFYSHTYMSPFITIRFEVKNKKIEIMNLGLAIAGILFLFALGSVKFDSSLIRKVIYLLLFISSISFFRLKITS